MSHLFALVSAGQQTIVPDNEIRQIKYEFITDRIRQSIGAWGKQPNLLANIIINSTMRLALLISKVLTAARGLKNKRYSYHNSSRSRDKGAR